MLLLPQFNKYIGGSPERLTNLPKVTQLVKGRTRLSNQWCGAQAYFLNHSARLHLQADYVPY